MLPPELLSLLVCPETHQDVTEASPAETAQLIEAIRAGDVLTVAGKAADPALEGALIRADRAVAYPIREGIPVMLIAEGLAIARVDLRREAALRA
jgi:uncharacterized protein YbaR (Trm112 family)